jgi:hypothetical protein
VFWGLLLGTLVGGAVALFKAPLLRASVQHNLPKPVSATPEVPPARAILSTPADPVAESRSQGIAAARRRRTELGV